MEAMPIAKVHLMCSCGRHILSRPRTNPLLYVGNDTCIVSIDRCTLTTLSSFLSHLLHILIEELDRAAPSSHMRLFMPHSPSQNKSWFFDALKCSSIMQQNADSMLLDTSSSFGSTFSSSASFNSIPPSHDDHDCTYSHSISNYGSDGLYLIGYTNLIVYLVFCRNDTIPEPICDHGYSNNSSNVLHVGMRSCNAAKDDLPATFFGM
ncbi:hypothetical protein E2542_SST27705 [Spatholobus suberectus]|nr:hypothetical protein E2542_SST27705 [Spatholobus suberectus]